MQPQLPHHVLGVTTNSTKVLGFVLVPAWLLPKLNSKGKNSLRIKNLQNRRVFVLQGGGEENYVASVHPTMTLSLKSYSQKYNPLTTKEIKLRGFGVGLLHYLISEHNRLQQNIG